MMTCARTSSADRADRGPDEVRAHEDRERESDRLIEEWITSRIEGVSHRSKMGFGPRSVPIEPSLRRVRPQRVSDSDRSASPQGWKRLHLDHRGEVTVVHLVDPCLIHEGPLAELRSELRAVTTAGCSRIILNLGRVEQVSSQFLEILTTLDRLCSSRPGGRLKLCGIGAEVQRILELCGLERFFEVAPDLPLALDGPWPTGGCRVPIELLGFLDQPWEIGSESSRMRGSCSSSGDLNADRDPPVHLTIRRERVILGTLRIPPHGLRIGRDAPCELRLRHLSVSREHAWIGFRDGQLHLEDLGSSNGTMRGKELLRSSSIVLRRGESFSIGPYHLATAAPVVGEDSRGGDVSEPARQGTTSDEWQEHSQQNDEVFTASGDQGSPCLRVESINDVMVLAPTLSQLDQEDAIEELRACLDRLIRRPNRIVNVVMNLAPVASLSGRAIGLILAQHLKLRRQGGSLRLAQPSPSVRVALEVVGVPTLIETFSSLDDAVLSQWPA